MPDILAGLAHIGFKIAWIGAAVSWLAILVFGIKAIGRTRPGVDLWGRDTGWNPANVLMRPSLLTSEGLIYRRRCFVAFWIFLCCVGVSLAIAALTGNLRY